MIKVVAFDYGGVLGCEADDWTNTFRKVLEIANLSSEEMLTIWEKHWPKLKIGKEPTINYWIDTAKKEKLDPQKLRKLYNKSITLNKKVLSFANSLKNKHKLIILSNDSKDWVDAKISRFALKEIFQKIYVSGNLGVAKPDKIFFELALRDLKIKPEELLFVDNQKNNIGAANKLAINTILFSNQTHTISHLQKCYKNIIRNIN